MAKSTSITASQDLPSMLKAVSFHSFPLVLRNRIFRIQDYFAPIGVFQIIFLVLAILISWGSSIHGKEVAEWYTLFLVVVLFLSIVCSIRAVLAIIPLRRRHKRMIYDNVLDYAKLAKFQSLHFISLHLTVCTILMGIAFVAIIFFGGLEISAVLASFFLGLAGFVFGSFYTFPKSYVSSIVLFVPQIYKFYLPNAHTPDFLSHRLLVQLSLNCAYATNHRSSEARIFLESISDTRAYWPKIGVLPGTTIKTGLVQRIAGLWRFLPHTLWIVALVWLLSAVTPPNLIPPIPSPFSFLPAESNVEDRNEKDENENSQTQSNTVGDGDSQGNTGNSSNSGVTSSNGNTNTYGSNTDSKSGAGGSNNNGSGSSSDSQNSSGQTNPESANGGNDQEYQVSQARNMDQNGGTNNNSSNNNSGQNGGATQSNTDQSGNSNQGARNTPQNGGSETNKGQNGNFASNGKGNGSDDSGQQESSTRFGNSGKAGGNQPQKIDSNSENNRSPNQNDSAQFGNSGQGNSSQSQGRSTNPESGEFNEKTESGQLDDSGQQGKSQQQNGDANPKSRRNGNEIRSDNTEKSGQDPAQKENNNSAIGDSRNQGTGQSNNSGQNRDSHSQGNASNSTNVGSGQQHETGQSNNFNQDSNFDKSGNGLNTQIVEESTQTGDAESNNNIEAYTEESNGTEINTGPEQLDFSTTEVKFPEYKKDQAELSSISVMQALHPMVQFVNSEIDFSSCPVCSNLVLKSHAGESIVDLTGEHTSTTNQKLSKGEGSPAKQRIPSWIHEITQQSE